LRPREVRKLTGHQRVPVVLLICLAIGAFGRARESKRLEILPGGHFDAYVSGFQGASTPALNWFKQHLMN